MADKDDYMTIEYWLMFWNDTILQNIICILTINCSMDICGFLKNVDYRDYQYPLLHKK